MIDDWSVTPKEVIFNIIGGVLIGALIIIYIYQKQENDSTLAILFGILGFLVYELMYRWMKEKIIARYEHKVKK